MFVEPRIVSHTSESKRQTEMDAYFFYVGWWWNEETNDSLCGPSLIEAEAAKPLEERKGEKKL